MNNAFVIAADLNFTIEDILTSKSFETLAINKNLSFLIDPLFFNSYLEFINDLEEHKKAYKSTVNILYDKNSSIPLTLFGIIDEENVYIAAFPDKDINQISTFMQSCNNSRITKLSEFISDVLHNEPEENYYFEELSRINNELINTKRELSRKNRELKIMINEKNQLMGIVSHDLKSPLMSIYSIAEYYSRKSSYKDEVIKKVFNTFYSTLKQSLNLMQEVLDFSASKHGDEGLHKELTDIISLIKDTIRLNKVLAVKKHIRVSFRYKKAIPCVPLDRNKMSRVITNLIQNAVAYSKPNSRICVKVWPVKDLINISFRDQGEGIAGEDLQHIFKPYYRAKRINHSREQGTGLGLSIVKNIIELHNGSISVQSRLGKGTLFKIKIPLS